MVAWRITSLKDYCPTMCNLLACQSTTEPTGPSVITGAVSALISGIGGVVRASILGAFGSLRGVYTPGRPIRRHPHRRSSDQARKLGRHVESLPTACLPSMARLVVRVESQRGYPSVICMLRQPHHVAGW